MKKIEFKNLPSMETPISADNLNTMQSNIEENMVPTKLLAVTNVAPTSANVGDMYFNTTDKKLYTATDTNPTWDTGIDPSYDKIYIDTRWGLIYYYNGDTLIGVGVNNTPTGTISFYGGNTDPVGWMICDGRAISRTTYADLFAIIGESFGIGDGETTFNIPNVKGKTLVGVDANDNDFGVIGKSLGEKNHVLTISEMPKHYHNMYENGRLVYWDAHLTSVGGPGSGSSIQTTWNNRTAETGNNKEHNNIQPSLVVNTVIKVF